MPHKRNSLRNPRNPTGKITKRNNSQSSNTIITTVTVAQNPSIVKSRICQCGTEAVKSQTKNGSNQGRWYYACPIQGCFGTGYFQWADSDTDTDSEEIKSEEESDEEVPDEHDLCFCGLETERKQVVKSTKNYGRFYRTCPNRFQKGCCRFFRWELA